jgi:hypothetical protein
LLPDDRPAQHVEAVEKYKLKYFGGFRQAEGLQPKGRISFGSNSGHQAIHMAYHLGATRIVLLGYDFKSSGSGTGQHFFGEHPEPLKTGHDYKRWLASMQILANDLNAAGVEVINCTRDTAITCFPRAHIAEIYPD